MHLTSKERVVAAIAGLLLASSSAVWALGTNYVALGGGNNPPYASWTDAATNIQTAVGYACSNLALYDTVMVSNGTYNITNGIVITNAVNLVSMNGKAAAFLNGMRSTASAVVVISNANAIVDGFTISNCNFRGVWMGGGTIRNCTISSNTYNGNGGGFCMTNGLMSNCLVIANYAGSASTCRGGGGYVASGVVVDCIIVSNRSVWPGGGCYNGTFVGCRFMYNSTIGNGGGGGLSDGTARNCLFAYNTGNTDGGGSARSTLENCTVFGNRTGNYTSGGVLSGTVRNCIIYGNDGANIVGATVSFTCSTPVQTGDHNIDCNPCFADTAADDFHLRFGSKAIDAGTNIAAVIGDLDMTNARPQNCYGITNAYDMGCFEALAQTTGAFRCCLTVSPAFGLNSLTSVCAAVIAGDASATNVTYYGWNFGDGHTVSGADKSRVTNVFGLGRFTVSLTVSNSLGTVTNWVATNAVQVAATSAYVTMNGTGVFPYASWDNAASNIQDAVDAAAAAWEGGATGARVLVSNGTYMAISSPITIQQGVRLESVAGYGNASLVCGSNQMNVVSLYHSNAVLSGFTVSNGNFGGIYMTNGTVENCLIISNRISGNIRSGGGFYMTAGLISNCIIAANDSGPDTMQCGGGGVMAGGNMVDCLIVSNKSVWPGGGVYRMSGSPVLTRCRFLYNSTSGNGGGGGLSGGAARNCLFAYNTGNTGGGGALNAALENCTVVSNNSPSATGAGGAQGCNMTNCIVYFNTAASGSNVVGGTAAYTCTTNPTVAGTGNISADPMFACRDNADFHLRYGSPCVGAGATNGLSWLTPESVDLDGNPRVVREMIDMGCYEQSLRRGALFSFQ